MCENDAFYECELGLSAKKDKIKRSRCTTSECQKLTKENTLNQNQTLNQTP